MRSRLLLLLAVLTVLLPVSSAEAVGTFGGPVTVSSSCQPAALGIGTDGKTRGFLSCGGTNKYVEGSGSRWTVSAAPFSGQVLAAAVGGTTTYFLLQTSNGLYLKSRAANGSLTAARKLSSATSSLFGVTLTAYGSQWWAIWGELHEQGSSLFEAHTLAGTGAVRRAYGAATSHVYEGYPSIAWMSSTKTAVIAWTHGRSAGTYSVVRATSKGGAWGSVSGVDQAGSLPVVVASGSTVVIADHHGITGTFTLGVYVGGATGGMSLHASSLPINGPHSVAISGGRITAGYNASTSQGTRARVVERNGSSWTEATYTAPKGGSVWDTQSYGGRARTFFTGSAFVVRSQ